MRKYLYPCLALAGTGLQCWQQQRQANGLHYANAHAAFACSHQLLAQPPHLPAWNQMGRKQMLGFLLAP